MFLTVLQVKCPDERCNAPVGEVCVSRSIQPILGPVHYLRRKRAAEVLNVSAWYQVVEELEAGRAPFLVEGAPEPAWPPTPLNGFLDAKKMLRSR